MSSKIVGMFEYWSKFSSLDSLIEALQDQDGDYRLSAVSPDIIVQMARDEHAWGKAPAFGALHFSYGELAYDMWGNPGNIRIGVDEFRDMETGMLQFHIAWNPLNLSL